MKNMAFEFVNLLQYAFAVMQSNEVFQLVEFILSIVTTLVLVVLRIYTAVRSAKKDGKVTEEEKDQIIKEVTDGIEEIKEVTEKGKEKKDG